MTLQSQSKITCITRFILTAMLLIVATVSAAAQDTNTFPSSGNAGVGTTTPTLQSGTTNTMVEVKGTVNPGVGLTSTAAGGRQYFVYSSQANPGYFSVFDATAGADRFVIGSSGNVGIGTAIPSDPLHVRRDQNASTQINLQNSTAGTVSQVQFRAISDTYVGIMGAYSTGTTAYGAATPGSVFLYGNSPSLLMMADNPSGIIKFATGGTGEKVRIDSSGNVGIGTTSPNPIYKLDVNGEINATGIRINGTPISGGGGSSPWSGTGSIHYNGGNVGIGTSTPASNLQVGSQTPGATGSPVTLSLGGSYSNLAGANLKLKLYDDGVVGNAYGIGVSSGSMDFGVSPTAGYHWYAAGVNKMTLTSNGDLSVSGSIAAKYQDLAEWVPSSEQLSAGTVVVLDTTKSNQVVSSTTGYDTRVAGVISAQPGITLGESGEGKVLVATTGRVTVKVDASRGAIQIGDLLVTSDVTGVAMKSEPVEFAGRKMHMPGTIIGKALEPLAKGSGEILVLLSLQ